MDRLLALVSEGWWRAWEAQEGGYAGFLTDVSRAWRAASAADVAQVKRGGLPFPLPSESHQLVRQGAGALSRRNDVLNRVA